MGEARAMGEPGVMRRPTERSPRARGSAVPWLATLATLAALGACGDGGTDDRADGNDGVGVGVTVTQGSGDCSWTVAGHDLARTHTTDCPEAPTPAELERLEPVWFHETDAEVTGAPVVDDERIYFGDWDGVLRAVDRADGDLAWSAELPSSPHVYSGQSPASPVLARVDGVPVVVATSGSTVVARARSDGAEVWATNLAETGDPDDPTEIEGAPVVAGASVLVPSDVHGADGYRSGLVSLSLADGSVNWRFDPEAGAEARGCGAVWGSPGVDEASGLVVVGTGNCNHDEAWTDASEAIVGIDLDTGELRWSFQPHERGNRNDWDFAGAPNLYEIDGRPVAGLGNKDGSYYVVDRDDGELVWSAEAQRQAGSGDGFAFGGFIGALALVEGVLVGGTAVGDCPCQHAFDAATGELLWQSDEPTGTYAPAAGVAHPDAGGYVLHAGVDQTLRAFDSLTGETLWETTLPAISSSGAAVAGDEVFIGVGFREPGSPATGGGGVQAYRVIAEGEAAPSSSTTAVPSGPAITAVAAGEQACVGTPCDVPFTLKEPPPGASPGLGLQVEPEPLAITVTASGLGEPGAWLDPDGGAAEAGATTYMVFLTPRDDRPEIGSILCTFTAAEGGCSTDRIPVPAERWTRLSVVATVDADTPPTLREGFDRLVTTHSFDPPLEAVTP